MTFSFRPEQAPQGSVDPTLSPGEAVDVIGGRYRGAHAVLEGFEDVPTPSGSTVRVARIRRPRAGVTFEFPDMLRRR